MTRVLIVDDEPAILESLSLILEDAGYEVAKAPDGKLAIIKIGQFLPDIVLSDWTMPTMGGEELLRWLSASARFKSVPTIIMSALVPHTPYSLSGFLQKPFSANAMLELLARIGDEAV